MGLKWQALRMSSQCQSPSDIRIASHAPPPQTEKLKAFYQNSQTEQGLACAKRGCWLERCLLPWDFVPKGSPTPPDHSGNHKAEPEPPLGSVWTNHQTMHSRLLKLPSRYCTPTGAAKSSTFLPSPSANSRLHLIKSRSAFLSLRP